MRKQGFDLPQGREVIGPQVACADSGIVQDRDAVESCQDGGEGVIRRRVFGPSRQHLSRCQVKSGVELPELDKQEDPSGFHQGMNRSK